MKVICLIIGWLYIMGSCRQKYRCRNKGEEVGASIFWIGLLIAILVTSL